MNWMNTYMSLQGMQGTNSYINQAYGSSLGNSAVGRSTSFGNVFRTTAQRSGSAVSISTPMDEIFEEASRAYGVDVNLLKAIAKAESGFNADATSSAGAMGVMQLMPGTAQSLGVTDPYDARQNIMGGAKYISDKLNAYGGDVTLALASYNAGSGNVEKYGGVPPFPETQNYIQKIMGYLGQNLSSGMTVQSSSGTYGNTSGGTTAGSAAGNAVSSMGFDSESVQYLMDMMRMQMDMKLSSVVSGMFDEESSNIGF